MENHGKSDNHMDDDWGYPYFRKQMIPHVSFLSSSSSSSRRRRRRRRRRRCCRRLSNTGKWYTFSSPKH